MLPQLVGQMAMAKYKQSLQPDEQEKDYTLGPEQIRFRGKTEIARGKEKTDKPTFTNLEGGIFAKWLEKKPLSKREQSIIDKKFAGTGKTSKDVYADSSARWRAKADMFEKLMNRKATSDELRRLFIADPYGILAPEDLPEGLTEADITYNMDKYGKSRQEIIDQHLKLNKATK